MNNRLRAFVRSLDEQEEMIDMCGIAGFIRLDMTADECLRLSERLLENLMCRGRDATGIYTKGWILKAPCTATEFIAKGYLDRVRRRGFGVTTLLHTRAATLGSPQNGCNNHPLIGPKYVMVHNGTVSLMRRLPNYEYRGAVDSEILLSYIEEYGMVDGLNKVEGGAAICLMKRNDPETVWIWRNSDRPMSVGLIKGKAIVWASTPGILHKAIRETFGLELGFFPLISAVKLETHKLYTITREGVETVARTTPIERVIIHRGKNKNREDSRAQKWDWHRWSNEFDGKEDDEPPETTVGYLETGSESTNDLAPVSSVMEEEELPEDVKIYFEEIKETEEKRKKERFGDYFNTF